MPDPLPRAQAPERPAPPPPSATPPPPPDRGKAPGWRVQPGPDGRGAPPPPKQPMLPRFGWRFVALIIALF
ncbi:MAG: hypothetical protein LC777_15330, partial [Actinobacteria bacterium]|nr:hypothetical protein [Actinomycetota bacterium]